MKDLTREIVELDDVSIIKPFTPTDRFSLFQNNEWKSPLQLLVHVQSSRIMLLYNFHFS